MEKQYLRWKTDFSGNNPVVIPNNIQFSMKFFMILK